MDPTPNLHVAPPDAAAQAQLLRPWSPWVRDPVLLAERQGRWRWPWALIGTAWLIPTWFVLFSVLDSLQAELARATGTVVQLAEQAGESTSLKPGNWHTFLGLATFGIGLGLPILLMPWLHKRRHGFYWRFHALPGSGAKLFAKGVCAMSVAVLVSALIEYIRDPNAIKLHATMTPAYFGWIGAAIAALLLQTLAEELVFRGYLVRVWGAVVGYRFAVAGAIMLTFTSLHTQNEDFRTDMVFNFIAFFMGEAIYYWVLFRTGSLALTWGLHFANNLVAFVLLVRLPGNAPDMALFTYTDPVLAAGGSRLYSPGAYLELVLTALFVVALFTWRWSPLYLPKVPLPDVPSEPVATAPTEAVVEAAMPVADATKAKTAPLH